MKAILFCNLAYSFSILKPLEDELKKRDYQYIWYIPNKILNSFKYKNSPYTSNIQELENFHADMIFVPGNDVPWYLRGVKIQIFHGLAGEKKGHFRIRDYFDLYLTQGPYFTSKFQQLSNKHKNFTVIETGWCKLDNLYKYDHKIQNIKTNLLLNSGAQKIILYAPTFSPSLTSAKDLFEQIVNLSKNKKYLIVVKFHDKMEKSLKQLYQNKQNQNLQVIQDIDILNALKYADLLISDTSSVVYEFLLLNKPVITYKSRSLNISWENIDNPNQLQEKVDTIFFKKDYFQKQREEIIKLYHPYNDGKSSKRVLDATLTYIKKYGVPNKRSIPILRKIKMIKKYRLLRW